MDEDLIIMFMLTLMTTTTLYSVWKKKRNRRRYAVRPINHQRNEKGMFNNVLQKMLLKDHDSFFKYCRMTPTLFFHLLRLVEPHLQKDETKRPIPVAQRLIVTLHYLAEGCSMQELAWGHMLGHCTVWKIIHETTEVLWNVLSPIYLKPPSTTNEWRSISNGFYNRWNMPNCIGAVDGKHINIQAPYHGGSLYFNYKKHHSIVLMASCDAFYRFIAVDIGAAGSNHDSTVFKESGFGHALLKNKCGVPPNQNLPKTNTMFPFFFVADAAFPLSNHIMRPYPGENLAEEKRIFNYRLSRARRTIENTFGVLVQRWRILRKPIVADVSTAEKITLATVALHNFLQRTEEDIPEAERCYTPTGYVDSQTSNGIIIPGAWRNERILLRSVGRLAANNSQAAVRANRDILCDYFTSDEGCVPWQQESILRGSLPDTL